MNKIMVVCNCCGHLEEFYDEYDVKRFVMDISGSGKEPPENMDYKSELESRGYEVTFARNWNF